MEKLRNISMREACGRGNVIRVSVCAKAELEYEGTSDCDTPVGGGT